jgi:hypothetical protein
MDIHPYDIECHNTTHHDTHEYKDFPKGGPPKDLGLRVFSNVRRTHEYNNLHACKGLSFSGNIQNRRISPWLNPIGFLSLGEIL